MEYTMALTRRHLFPREAMGAIYPTSNEDNSRRENETGAEHQARMDAWADFTIPADCTRLRVYMSGYVTLRKSLIRVCRSRGIEVCALWPKTSLRKKIKKGEVDRGIAMDPNCYRETKLYV